MQQWKTNGEAINAYKTCEPKLQVTFRVRKGDTDGAPPASFLFLRSSLDLKPQIKIEAREEAARVPLLQALQGSADLYARYEFTVLGSEVMWVWRLEQALRAGGPARCVDGDALGLNGCQT